MQQNPATVLSQDQTYEQGQFIIYILLHITDQFKVHIHVFYFPHIVVSLQYQIYQVLVHEFGQLYLYLTKK